MFVGAVAVLLLLGFGLRHRHGLRVGTDDKGFRFEKKKWMGYTGGDGNELGFWFLLGVLELLTLCE